MFNYLYQVLIAIFNESDFSLKRTGNLSKDFLFPQIYNGKLQYTRPVMKNGVITDWKTVKEE